MPAPNHNPNLFLHPEDAAESQIVTGLTEYGKFPLLKLLLPENDYAGNHKSILFVDEKYDTKHWTDREGGVPPTWMDPEVFARMVLADPRTEKVVTAYVKKGTAGKRLRLQEVIQDVFEQEYIPYLKKQFEKARHTFSCWVSAYIAARIEWAEDDVKYRKLMTANRAKVKAAKAEVIPKLVLKPKKKKKAKSEDDSLEALSDLFDF